MRRVPSSILLIALFACALAVPRSAVTQGPGGAILQLNQQAMAAYGSLQISRALELLTQAEAMCRQYRVGGMALARTYVNMGLVEAGGMSNNAAAMRHFTLALCSDPGIGIDPLNSTPDIEVLFNMARAQAQAPGACQGVIRAQPLPPPQPLPVPSPQPPAPTVQTIAPASPAAPPMKLTRHQPVAEQQRLVPIPLFVEVNPNVQVATVALFYRTLGERVFQQLPMVPLAHGYATTIGCDVLQTFDPTGIEYYIAVYGPNQQLLGTTGTESQPLQIVIVPQRSGPEPALPGLPPPVACVESCPPWNPDCNKNCKKDGAMCDSTAECCGGYSCIKETCTPTGEQGRSEETQERRVRIPLSVGTGFGFLPAENTKQAYNQIAPGNLSLNAGTAWDKFHVRLGVLYQLIPELALGLAFRGDMALDFNGNVPFMRPAFFVNAEYRVFSSAEERFELWSLFGLGGGIFQHRVSYKDCSVTQDKPEECANLEKDPAGRDVWTGENPVDETFFRKSGYVILEAGLGARYWFKKGGVFGWNVEILADLLFAPSFAFNFDFHTGPVLRF